MTVGCGRLFDAAVNAIILCACLLITLAVVMARTVDNPSPRTGGKEPNLATSVSGLQYEQADITVLLVLNSACSFCTDSMSGLRRIASACQRAPGRARCVVVGAEASTTLRAYMADNGLIVEDVYSVEPGAAVVEYSPRVLIVGRDAKVRREWLGLIDDARGREVGDVIRQLQGGE